MASNLILMLRPEAMASNLLVMATNLIAMARTLLLTLFLQECLWRSQHTHTKKKTKIANTKVLKSRSDWNLSVAL